MRNERQRAPGGVQVSATDWAVAVIAATVEGEVVLRMTVEQADDLRDHLVWLTGDDE